MSSLEENVYLRRFALSSWSGRLSDMTSKLGNELIRPMSSPAFINAAVCPRCSQGAPLRAVTAALGHCRACGFYFPLPTTNLSHAAPRVTALPPGLYIGALLRERYRIVDLLGRGAHGITLRAHHEFLNHPCVIKVLPQRIVHEDDDSVRRLRTEASAGFRVNHPNVVRVLDGDVADGIWYFVMEYVDGADLGMLTQDAAPLAPAQVIQIAFDAARGLDAIHRAGLLHGDVKPANLILDTQGCTRIADLGVVRALHHSTITRVCEAEAVSGTLDYAAPEVLSETAAIGPSADLYSLGITLYELLTGRLPPRGGVFARLTGQAPEELSWPSRAPQTPRWLVDLVLELAARSPADRPASAAVLIQRLEREAEQAAPCYTMPQAEPAASGGFVVLPLENAGAMSHDDWLGHALAEHLSRALAQQQGAYVVNVDQYLPMLERIHQRPHASRSDELMEAGRLCGAAIVIAGMFERQAESIRMRLTLHRGDAASIHVLDPVEGPLSMLATLEARLYAQVVQALNLPGQREPKPIGPRAPLDPRAQQRFFSAKQAFLRGDYNTAMQLARDALEIDPDFAEAVGFVGVCCARVGRYDEALEHNRRQQMLAGADGRLRIEAFANLGAMHYFRGEYEAANDCLTRAAREAEALGLPNELASIQNNLGFVLLQLGRQQEAAATYQAAIETHRRYGALVALIGPYNGMGHVFREQKNHEEAAKYFHRALALAQECDDFVNIGIAHMNIGHCALLEGRFAEARQELTSALNILERTSFWNGLARVYEYLAELNLKLDNLPSAVRCAERRIELAHRHANLRMEAAAWLQKAAALECLQRTAQAAACRAKARELNAALGRPAQ